MKKMLLQISIPVKSRRVGGRQHREGLKDQGSSGRETASESEGQFEDDDDNTSVNKTQLKVVGGRSHGSAITGNITVKNGRIAQKDGKSVKSLKAVHFQSDSEEQMSDDEFGEPLASNRLNVSQIRRECSTSRPHNLDRIVGGKCWADQSRQQVETDDEYGSPEAAADCNFGRQKCAKQRDSYNGPNKMFDDCTG